MEFVFLNGDESLPIRERQLRQSAVRSHVAKITYASEKRIQKLVKLSSSRTEQTVSEGSRVRADLNAYMPVYPGFGSFRSELLQVLPQEANFYDLRLFDCLTQILLPGMDIATEIFSIRQVYHFLLPNLCGTACFHACMALMHLVDDNEESSNPTVNHRLLEHRGRALLAVRTHLQSDQHSVTENILIAIMLLTTLDGNMKNPEAYASHVAVLKHFINSQGYVPGPSHMKFNDFIKMYCEAGPAIGSGKALFQRRPFVPTSTTRPRSINWQKLARALPPGLAELLQHETLSADTIAVLERFSNLSLHTAGVTLTSSKVQELAQRRRLPKKYLNYLDSVPIVLTAESPAIMFEKALMLTLSLFVSYGFCETRKRHMSLNREIENELMGILLKLPNSSSRNACLAWMWLILIDSWRIGGDHGTVHSHGRVIIRQFLQLFPNYCKWSALQQLTRLFFWTGNMEKFWRQNWNLFTDYSEYNSCIPKE